MLKDGALAGYLTPGEARGANLLMGLEGESLYNLSDGRDGTATVELRQQRSALQCSWDAPEPPLLEVRLSVRAGVVELSGAAPLSEETLSLLESELAAAVARQAEDALRRSRELDADYLELYRLFRLQYPRLPMDPGEDFLSSLSWRVTAEAVVERSFDIDSGAHSGEEDSRHAS